MQRAQKMDAIPRGQSHLRLRGVAPLPCPGGPAQSGTLGNMRKISWLMW